MIGGRSFQEQHCLSPTWVFSLLSYELLSLILIEESIACNPGMLTNTMVAVRDGVFVCVCVHVCASVWNCVLCNEGPKHPLAPVKTEALPCSLVLTPLLLLQFPSPLLRGVLMIADQLLSTGKGGSRAHMRRRNRTTFQGLGAMPHIGTNSTQRS